MYGYIDYHFQPDEILIYLRKSRSDDPLLSIEEVLEKHETILNNWCARNLIGSVPEENRFREIVSGETIEDRPEIKKVLQKIESPRIKAILVVEVQRLSRGDLEDAGRLIKLLRYTNTAIITPQKTYDLQNEYDRDFFERELKRGNEFLEYQKKIMSRGRLLSVQQGNYIGSQPPYGYERTIVMDGKRKCPTLKIKEDEARVVRMIFDMYVNEDMGRTNICHRLDKMGISPPRGEFWSPSALKDMLENVHYIGKVKWNWRKEVTVVEDGEIVRTRPKAKKDNFLIFDGKHEPIISEELFDAAQAKQGRNHRAKANTKIRNPLAGLIYCQCGRAMSLRTYKKDGKERSAPRLLCDGQAHCHTSSCLFDEMTDMVCQTLKDAIADFEVQLQNCKKNKKIHQDNIKSLEKKWSELEAKELSLWDKYTEEGMPRHIFEQLKENLLKEKEKVAAALQDAKETMPTVIDYEERLCRFRDALAAMNDPTSSAQKKNTLLKACFERIDYTREKTERVKKNANEKEATKLPVGSSWTDTPISISAKLRL